MGDGMLSREELLKRAAVLGGAGLVASLGVGRAGAAIEALDAESGRLQVLDWAGYEVKPVWAPYAAKYPGQPPQFTFMTNEANALAKLTRACARTSSARTSATSGTSPRAGSSSRGRRRRSRT